MKNSSEVKVGLIGIATIVVLIWGMNYLKGKNILSNTYTLHAFYMDSGGLESSSPILMNGVKIGYVDEITLHPDEEMPIQMTLSIEKTYSIKSGFVATLSSLDLIGTKGIRIESPASSPAMGNRGLYADNDTIVTAIKPDMLSDLKSQILPVMERIGDLAVSLDHLAKKLDTILISQSTVDMLQDISEVARALASTLEPGGSLNQSLSNLESFSSMLKAQEDNFASLTGHLNSISIAVDSAGLDRLSAEIMSVSEQFNQLLQQINSGEGSAGKLIYSDSLYTNLEMLITDLDTLINGLNENPGDYVHFSLFGKNKAKE